jgi:outer membrane protein assembly factor BamB
MKILLVFLGGLLFATIPSIAAGPAGTTDWPEFRGPTGQGISEAKNLPRSWGKEKGVAWSREVPGGWASPVLVGGRLYLSAAEVEDGKVTLCAMSLDAETGQPEWRRDLFEPEEEIAKKRHAKNGLASPTPLVADGVIYVHFGHMGTAALKAGSGEVIWKRRIDYPPMHGNASSPVLVDGKIILNMDAEKDPAIMALDAKTGEPVWRTPRNQEVKRKFSFATPLVIEVGGEKQVISQASGFVGAYAPADGRLIWRVSYGEGYSVIPRPVMDGELLYVATGFGKPKLMAIRPEGAGGEVTGSHVVWEEDKWIPKTPSVIAKDGWLIILDDTGTLSGRDGKNGDLLWREKLVGNFSSSPVLAGGTLYACTEDGVCYVVEVTKEGAKVVSEIDMEERIFATPVVVDGAVYLRGEERVWKIAEGEG